MTLLADTGDAFFTHGAIEKARLTEAAAADTAAEDFFHRAVVDDLDIRQNKALRIIAGVHIHDRALFDCRWRAFERRDRRDGTVVMVTDVIQRGDIDAGNIRRHTQELGAGFMLALAHAVQLNDLEVDLFAVAEEENIDKVGDRLGVAGAGTARDDNMLQAVPILAENGDPAERKHIQNIGIAELILKRKADEIKMCKRIAGLERVKRDIVRAHDLLHVDPRGEHTLAPDIRTLVKQAVQDFDAQMGHADLIKVGKTKGKADIDVTLVLDNGAQLAADITAGLLHRQQILFQFFGIHRLSPVLTKRNQTKGPASCSGFINSTASRYSDTISSETLYPERSRTKMPAVISGSAAANVTAFMTRIQTVSEKRRDSSRYSSRPPSSDSTGSRLNRPSAAFA